MIKSGLILLKTRKMTFLGCMAVVVSQVYKRANHLSLILLQMDSFRLCPRKGGQLKLWTHRETLIVAFKAMMKVDRKK
jgi:hypothetical protein